MGIKDKLKRKPKSGKEKSTKEKQRDALDKIIFAGFTLIIVVFIAIALFAMDVFNFKTQVVDEVTRQLVARQEGAAAQYVGDDLLRRYEAIIGQEFGKLNIRDQQLNDWELDLTQREETLTEKEEAYQIKLDELNAFEVEVYGEAENIMELSKVIERMTPENAANMLSEVEDLELVKNVIFFIKEDRAAQILENMSPSLAARIVMERFISKPSSSEPEQEAN
jgi:flagellar motility protein MotE (MotC chaperone)